METPTGKSRPGSRAVYWIAALGLAAVLLYYSLRGIDWVRVWAALRGANPAFVALGLCSITLTIFLRAVRWRVLLSAGKTPSIPLAFWATSAGYLGNNVLPARAGELVRTMMMSRRLGISRMFVFTTALSERVSDAVAVIVIAAAALLALPSPPGWLAGAAKPFAILGLCGAAGIALAPVFEPFYLRLLARLPLPHALREKIVGILGHVLQGLRSFHNAGRLSKFLGLTGIIWTLDALNMILAARALGLVVGLPVAFLFVTGLGLGSALPSTPGYVGIYQFVAVTILTPFGYSRNDAIACVLLLQAMGYALILVWGSIGLLKERRWSSEAAEPVAPVPVAGN